MCKNYNRLLNLIYFNINFSSYVHCNNLINQSPDYIKEKYDHWIGFEPDRGIIVKYNRKAEEFLDEYNKVWKSDDSFTKYIVYLYITGFCNLNIDILVENFEDIFGPITKISSDEKFGLHEITMRDFVPIVLEKNYDRIDILLRDLNIRELID